MKVYKVRDKQTGLFSTGGCYPKFTKKGKTWKALNHVRTHLTLYRTCHKVPASWEIVEYEYTLTVTRVLPTKGE
jgi:hypothetical protein